MVGLITILVFAFLAWIITINIFKSKQTTLPLLMIFEGIALLSGGSLSYFDFDFLLIINTRFGDVSGHIKNPETNYVLIGCGFLLIIQGRMLWHSISTRVHILNMLGKVKHEISDKNTIDSLKLRDYQVKETVLDLRWAANDTDQYAWKKAKALIEEYVNEFSARSDASTICFTGMAPIPFEVYAGTFMTGHAIKRFFEYKRSENTYYELVREQVSLMKWLKPVKIPSMTETQLIGNNSVEVALVVSITQSVQDSDLAQFDCPIKRLGINEPKDNIMTSITQLTNYVDKTTKSIIELKRIFPRLIRVNLVSAAPSCYAFDLGCKLGHLDNRLPEIVVYHYVSTATPKYPYGIIVTGKNKGSLVIKN